MERHNQDEQQNSQQPTNEMEEANQAQQDQNHYHAEKDPGLTKPSKGNKVNNKPKSKSHPLLSGVIGGIISAVIVAALFTTNMIPINSSSNTGNNESSSSSDNQAQPAISNTIASDDTNIASNIDETSQAVVGIINKQQQSVWSPSQEVGSGSGIIYKKDDGKAYVVTNNHVVDGAEEVDVVLNNEEHIKAKVLGADSLTDLAVLQIDGSKIKTVAKLGPSDDLQIGDTVIAIGNPLGMKFSGSVTKGIISGLQRNIEIDTNGDRQPDWITEVIQTDAAINPGNSGGALVNENGEVIGINSMKIAQEAVEGIGFAIPIDSAIPIMEQLEKDGEIARPFIGISTASIDQVPTQYRQNIKLPEKVDGGMVIANVEAGSPADKAGLQQFDVITKINDKKITSLLDLRKYMYSETNIGDKINLEIYRNGKQKTIQLTLIERETK
ncbi:S1C family serine protease [Lentibacillus sp. Marseille-P4043]|uniref:S1C family serine protease n=1 Tax=Lentibacillus sp. Marseille-P4043 TaxID=2040293 RepID=UPI001F1636B0|nr:trypsin-like peptidase domain-containing protein [Lentibacillus sp. Marseille-P4043]